MKLEIRELQVSECQQAAHVLARGMQDNPLVLATWRLEPAARLQVLVPFFQSMLQGLFGRGYVLGAFDGETLVGVCGIAPPGRCRSRRGKQLRAVQQLLLTVLAGDNPVVALRLWWWRREWGRQDPAEAHWHLGPIAVDPQLQGRGIGGQLMAACCQRVDAGNALAYLETDKQQNVGFYERYGFQVKSQSQVLGVTNWFMLRPAGGNSGALR